MRVLLSTRGPREDVETRLWRVAPGARVSVCVPPDCAAAEERDAPVETGVMPTGVWR